MEAVYLVTEDPWEKNKTMIETVRDLCNEVRAVVRPYLGSAAAKVLEGLGASGDTTFGIDEVAETKIAALLEPHAEIAYYTEDRGLIAPPSATHLLIIDPIDGTRPAAAGLESCCVSVAVAPYDAGNTSGLTLGDVFFGAVREIKNDASFEAVRGAGVRFELEGRGFEPLLSAKSELNRIFWTAGYRGRPAEPLTTVLSELIDMSSVDGGYFDLGSATFSITRVVTGEMDVYVDPGQRMAEQVDTVRELFLEVGHGHLLNNFPYDLAAAALIASESGAVVSDAYGESLDAYPLVPEGSGGQMSSLVSANEVVHEAVLEQLDRGMGRLVARYGGGGS